jgi:hypothetical protein
MDVVKAKIIIGRFNLAFLRRTIMCRKLSFLASFVLVLGLTTTVANADIIDGQVAYWPLDEGAGTETADLSGNENHGTFLDSPTWVIGKFGGALDFDGDNDAVDCGNPPILDFGTGDWTVSAWIKASVNPGDDMAIFSKGMETSPNTDYQMRLRDEDDIMIRIDNDGTRYSPNTDDHEGLIDGNWHHIVGMRRDGTDLRVYVDGVEDTGLIADGRSTIPDSFDLSNTSEHNAYIGAVAGGAGNPRRWFLGLIDDVAVWNRALTADEVAYLWNDGDGNTAAMPETEKASNPSPKNGATVDLADATPLSWTAGEYAVKHDVYFGAAFDDVNDANASDTTGIYQGPQTLPIFTPTEDLELGRTYYWRIDEVNAPPDNYIYKGNVWSFTILDYVLVDDFEDYDVDNPIWESWRDGLAFVDGQGVSHPGNGTGAEVGDGTTASYTEETIVHGGGQSMPYWYNNKQDKAKYSESKKTLTETRDWTTQGVKALSLWFTGFPADFGSFTEGPAGTYTITAGGEDIWGDSDQFHFAYKELNGAGTIIAKVQSVSNTHGFAKAGVMIRDTLDPDSANAALLITPENGVRFQWRNSAGDNSERVFDDTVTAPQWIRLTRELGGRVRAAYSADGTTWTDMDPVTTVIMNLPMYVGLAVTSHDISAACVAEFSDVTSDGTGQWANQNIGVTSNEAEPMYVALSNSNGTTGTVYYDDNDSKDPNASLISTWTQWNIDLKDFSDQGVDLTDVNSIGIGFGDRDNPQAGGSGKMHFDDIRLYQPRCVLEKLTLSQGDFTGDCVVDFRDLEIMANDWLDGALTRSGPLLVHYKFEEGTGTVVADSSGNGNDGVFSGTAAWGPDEIGGSAAVFDGGVGEVRGDSTFLNGLSAMSFGAWIKSNIIGTDAGVIIFAEPSGNDQRDIRYDLDGSRSGGANLIKYGVATEEGSHENESTANVQTAEWQHVMVTWNSGEAAKLYINGVLDTPADEDSVIGGTTTGYTTLIVGRGAKDSGGSWEGLVDDVRVYEVALTAAEVQTVMNAGDVPVFDVYVPLTSVANLSDEEPTNSKKVNFKDLAVLADSWLDEILWPE